MTEQLAQRLLQRWGPKWYEAFTDGADGGFHERVGHSFKPVKTGQRRVLTQCRQLAIYGHAVCQGKNKHFKPDLHRHFEFIVKHYHRPYDESVQSGWLFSMDDGGKALDSTFDLYAHAFVIFAFAHYYKATGDEQAQTLAAQTLRFIDSNFRIKGQPGLTEALDEDGNPLPKIRRHETHMHLLEACLFAYESFDDPDYMKMAEEMTDLFVRYFYNGDDNLLSEYFSDDLKDAVPENGHVIAEPGHYCEWIWLLKKYELLSGRSGVFDNICSKLLHWANSYGWDFEYGGIFDELDPSGNVVNDTKRLWPFTEALKANALMMDAQGMDKDFLKQRMAHMVKVFKENYIEERGFWTEWLTRDFKPVTDYMPGTTPYHVYFGVMEARDALAARGKTKSLTTGIFSIFYTMRRGVSARIKSVRLKLSKKKPAL